MLAITDTRLQPRSSGTSVRMSVNNNNNNNNNFAIAALAVTTSNK